MMTGIYAIRNLISGKRYVGSAVNIERRWKTHKKHLGDGSHFNRYLLNAWNKYGPESFRFEVIELCEHGQLIAREQHHINLGAQYNISPTAGSCLGLKHTAEIRARLKAYRSTPEARAINSAASKKRMADPETIAKYRAGSRRRWSNPAEIAKNSAKGKAQWANYKAEEKAKTLAALSSPEARRKLSEAAKRRMLDLAFRAKVLAAASTPEVRAKISATMKRRMSDPAISILIQEKRRATMVSKSLWAKHDATTKYCPRCQNDKPLNLFHKNKTKFLGVHTHCKECTLAAENHRAKLRRGNRPQLDTESPGE